MKKPEEIKKELVEAIEEASWVVEGGDAHDLIDAVEKAHASMADALAYIKQLEAFAPPVTIGTPIFSVCYNEDRDGFFVKESTVAEIWYNCNGWFFLEERHVGPAFKKRDIGKLIYLNREEAEFICEEFAAKLPDPPKEG